MFFFPSVIINLKFIWKKTIPANSKFLLRFSEMSLPKSTHESHSSKLSIPGYYEYQHLDISYICHNMIVMSYPSNKEECDKNPDRNKIEEVKQYLEKKHKGHYYVINLSLEETQRSYSPEIFEGRVWFFGITDQSPPAFELLLVICEKIKSWLDKSEQNVVAIHCKEGIGRTGTIACCFLLYQEIASSAEQAVRIFSFKREITMKAIIPSQKCWIGYFESYLRNHRQYDPTPILIHSIRLGTTQSFPNYYQLVVNLGWMDGYSLDSINLSFEEKKKDIQEIILVLNHPKKVNRDFQLSFFERNEATETKMSSLTCLFRFWKNIAFLDDAYPVGEEQHFQFTLNTEELDIFTYKVVPVNLPSDLLKFIPYFLCNMLKVTVCYTRLAQEQEDAV